MTRIKKSLFTRQTKICIKAPVQGESQADICLRVFRNSADILINFRSKIGEEVLRVYSYLRESTGSPVAALMVWEKMIRKPRMNMIDIPWAKIPNPSEIRLALLCKIM